jgi:hypothetical protein
VVMIEVVLLPAVCCPGFILVSNGRLVGCRHHQTSILSVKSVVRSVDDSINLGTSSYTISVALRKRLKWRVRCSQISCIKTILCAYIHFR